MTDSSGPKTSSWPSRSIGFTPSKIVGWKKLPLVERLSPLARCAADDQSGRRPRADLDVAARPCRPRVRLMSGPTSVARLEAEPRRSLEARSTSSLDQLVGHRLVDDQPAAGGAALAGGPERRPDDAVDREVQVGVGHHDDAVLAAQLERDALEARAGARARSRGRCRVLPVKLMTGTSGLSTMAMPTASPPPVTRLTVPGGKPASAISSTSSTAQRGVSEAGLKHDRVAAR